MLQLTGITKTYKTASLEQQVLKGVSLSLRESEFVAILGQSGSGKTTLLNIIGGLDRYDDGELVINGVSTKKYRSRDWDSYRNHTVGFVFQSYNLIPHQTLLSNVELALTISGISKSERVRRAKEALDKVGLSEHIHKRPNQISGGQMQRVAIARALVNDPDILLADEPTGALDSETSIQVMDLLREVAQDRLVVMVTHNPELAEQYATRIVRLKDGRIEADSDPFEPGESDVPAVHRSFGRSSMSILTALALSFNNLWTKKARTLLVALAGSIGIIGIALIMSLSNGVNQYVADIESEALQNYPLTITDTSFSSTLLLAMAGSPDETLGLAASEEGSAEEAPEDAQPEEPAGEQKRPQVRELPMLSSIFSQLVTNDLASLMAYFESGESDIYDYVQTIEYDYNIDPQIYAELDSGIRQINPDQTFTALGFSAGGSTNALWSTFSSTDSFIPLPKKSELYEDSYDVMAGRWPRKYNECVVVLTSHGYIADMCLYAMGLKNPKELDDMMQAFADGTEIKVEMSDAEYTYDDFLGRSFKVVNASDLYTYDEEYDIWVSHSGDTKFIEGLLGDAEDLTIVGVVQPSEDNTSPIISMGIGYPAGLINHLIDDAADSEIVRQQLASPEINVLTGAAFGEEKDGAEMDMSSLFSLDESALEGAFDFDLSGLDFSEMDFSDVDLSEMDFSDMDFSDMDLSDIDFSDIDLSELESGDISLGDLVPELSEEQVGELLEAINFNISQKRLRRLLTNIWDGYMDYAEQSPYTDYNELVPALQGFLATEEARNALLKELQTVWNENAENFITADDLLSVFSDLMAGYDAYLEETLPENEYTYTLLDEYLQTEEARAIAENYAENLRQKYRASLMDDEQLRDLVLNMFEAYEDYADDHFLPMPSLLLQSFGEYLETKEGRQDLQMLVNSLIDSVQLKDGFSSLMEDFSGEGMDGALGEALEPVFAAIMEPLMEKIGQALQDNMGKVFEQMMGQFGEALSDSLADGFADAFGGGGSFENLFQSVMDMDELSSLMMSMFYPEDHSFEANLRKFGYADYSRPGTITIYPTDFDAKGKVKEILDDYNAMQRKAGEDDKVIAYTDAVDVLIGSVTDIVNVVSYVLIAFVSISLVVSSVMIGVITYISVLERRKEIGILRAIGASKRNISEVFNAETFITGALAGLLGVGITLISIPPINALIHDLTGQPNINAYLPLSSAGLLVLLSIVLTLIGGIIPSMKAAGSDPVAALRSE